jgi:hypothetical protein
MVTLGIMSIISLGTFKLLEIQQKAQVEAFANFEIMQLTNEVKQYLSQPEACKNTLTIPEPIQIGDSMEAIRNSNNKVVYDLDYNQNYVKIRSINLKKHSSSPLLAAQESGLAILSIAFIKRGSSIDSVKGISLNVNLDENGYVTDCSSENFALNDFKKNIKSEICTELGGGIVDGRCQANSAILCRNAFGEKGVKNTISKLYKGKIETYYRYASPENIELFTIKNCGIGDVVDSKFKDCIGHAWSLCGSPASAEDWGLKIENGLTCTKISFGNNLEWCPNQGSDGSWAKYLCANKAESFIFNRHCDVGAN